MSSILIVDDEAGVRASLGGVLRDEGYDVEAVDSGEACLEEVARAAYDVILLDVWLTGMDGLETLERLRERHVDAMVIMISGHASIESAVRATKLGAFDFIEKPLSLDKTVLVVRNAIRQHLLEVENRALRAKVDRQQVMVGSSRVMAALRDQIAVTAPTNGRVLIAGLNNLRFIVNTGYGLGSFLTLGSYADAEGLGQISSEIVIANNRCGGPDSNTW